MKEIKLTQGKVAIVDDNDYEYINQWKWYALKNHNGNYYAVRQNRTEDSKQKTVYMHREILKDNSNMQVDHISRDSLNNTRDNLRKCTPAQNSRNKRNQIGSSSKYKGVSVFRDKWKAEITCDNVRVYLGIFDSEYDAALAYDKNAVELFGEFANINFK